MVLGSPLALVPSHFLDHRRRGSDVDPVDLGQVRPPLAK